MRYAAFAVLFFASVLCGCAAAPQTGSFLRVQGQGYHRGRYSNYPPPGYAPRPRQEQQFIAGFGLGTLAGVSTEAVDSYPDTEFEGGTLFTGSLVFLFPDYRENYRFMTRYGVELRFDNYDLLLSENAFDFGRLTISSVTAAFKFYQLPVPGSAVGFHFDAGIGIGGTSFSKDSELLAEEVSTGVYRDIDVGASASLVFGGGLDIFIGPNAFLTIDLRFADTYVPVDWYENGILRGDVDWFDASTLQFVVGLSFIF
jgi:hypothetical protein